MKNYFVFWFIPLLPKFIGSFFFLKSPLIFLYVSLILCQNPLRLVLGDFCFCDGVEGGLSEDDFGLGFFSDSSLGSGSTP